MPDVLVLAMHGAPPNDFPKAELAELFSLHGRLEQAPGPHPEPVKNRYDELEARVRQWPRTEQNDPFHAASLELGVQLGAETGCEVLVGFNEFCSPSLDEALDQAAARRPDRIIVVTPMMTRGGQHAEVDIPAAIQQARSRHPGLSLSYAWPFEARDVARFLASEIAQLT